MHEYSIKVMKVFNMLFHADCSIRVFYEDYVKDLPTLSGIDDKENIIEL